MDDFRKEVIKELEKKLGDDYKIFPQDRTKNNVLPRMAFVSVKKVRT